ncbi:hypothetical protein C8F04DRAFT_1188194 [Mycena alexandri]|uniref:Uncharacterized protein n=1 Tax=Mycena alexandri TaxID=1745969 RepID=A0AAD6SJ23_9AGAR|nr:hypothetical protein C8F04DRAFT_1188194 [Mycena alexandri]
MFFSTFFCMFTAAASVQAAAIGRQHNTGPPVFTATRVYETITDVPPYIVTATTRSGLKVRVPASPTPPIPGFPGSQGTPNSLKCFERINFFEVQCTTEQSVAKIKLRPMQGQREVILIVGPTGPPALP